MKFNKCLRCRKTENLTNFGDLTFCNNCFDKISQWSQEFSTDLANLLKNKQKIRQDKKTKENSHKKNEYKIEITKYKN